MKKRKRKKRNKWLEKEIYFNYARSLFDFDAVLGFFLVKVVAGFLGWFKFRVVLRSKIEIIDKKNIPKTGKILFYANHPTIIDPFYIQIITCWPRCIIKPWFLSYVPAAEENFFLKNSKEVPILTILSKLPFIKETKIFSWIIGHGHALKVEVGRRDQKVLKKLIEKLRKGRNVTIFPEGARTRNSILNNFQPGITSIIDSGKPNYIIPIWIEGMDKVLSINNRRERWKNAKVKIIIGPSIKRKVDELSRQTIQEKTGWLAKLNKFRLGRKREKRFLMLKLLRDELLILRNKT